MVYNVINGIYGFIAVPILINYFGKAEYGLIGLAMSINVYTRLMDMGFNNTNVRFFSAWLSKDDKEHVNRLFQTSLAFYGCIGILNSFIMLVISFFTSQLFHLTPEQDQILKSLLYILAFSSIVSWFSSCFDQLISATENVGWIKRLNILSKVLQIAVLVITVYGELSIFWFYLLSTLALYAILPFSIGKIKIETPFVHFIPKFYLPVLKEILPYALNIFSFSIFQFSFYNLRPVFLGMQGTVESVADYNVLNGIVGTVTMFGSVFMGALLPSSAKAVAADNKEAYYRVAYDATKYISIVLSFCAFGMMTVGKELLTVYVGDGFLYLIPWLNLWLLCTLGVHNQAISSLILAGTDIRAISYSSVFASIVGLLLAWFLIPVYQIGGVVIAFAVYCIIQLAFFYFYYWPKHMHINSWKVFSYSFFPYVIIGTTLYFLINFATQNIELGSWWLLLIKGLGFAIPYLLIIFFMLPMNEKLSLISLVKR